MGFQLSYAAEADVPEAVKAVYVQKGDRGSPTSTA